MSVHVTRNRGVFVSMADEGTALGCPSCMMCSKSVHVPNFQPRNRLTALAAPQFDAYTVYLCTEYAQVKVI